jgi:preprotein translocase subunit YajC
VISRALTWVSTIAALVVLASFAMFAIDQAQNGSKQQVSKLAGEIEPNAPAANVNQADPTPRTERKREKMHGQVREAVDDADDVLVKPFAGAASSTSSIWAQRGIPALLAFLVFGVGLRLLAAYVPGGARR